MHPKIAEAYRLAYGIVEPGASNPSGVALAVADIVRLLREAGRGEGRVDPPINVERHPAFRAAVGHLAFLAGISLGPEDSDYNAVIHFGKPATQEA